MCCASRRRTKSASPRDPVDAGLRTRRPDCGSRGRQRRGPGRGSPLRKAGRKGLSCKFAVIWKPRANARVVSAPHAAIVEALQTNARAKSAPNGCAPRQIYADFCKSTARFCKSLSCPDWWCSSVSKPLAKRLSLALRRTPLGFDPRRRRDWLAVECVASQPTARGSARRHRQRQSGKGAARAWRRAGRAPSATLGDGACLVARPEPLAPMPPKHYFLRTLTCKKGKWAVCSPNPSGSCDARASHESPDRNF